MITKDGRDFLKQEVLLLKYDMQATTERWLRVENKYDRIIEERKRSNLKIDIIILLQLFVLIMMGVS